MADKNKVLKEDQVAAAAGSLANDAFAGGFLVEYNKLNDSDKKVVKQFFLNMARKIEELDNE